MKHCSFTVSPSHPTCSCPDAVLYPRRWGVRDVRESRVEWRTCSGLHDEKEHETEREKEKNSVHPCSFLHPATPSHGWLLHCWSVSKRREKGRVQLIRDQRQSVSVLISDQEQWVGPAPSLPYAYPSSPTPHPPPDISPLLIAAGPVDRGGPPWPSTVRGWCSSGTDAGHLHVQREGVSRGQSRHGLWSLEGGPVCGRDVLIQKTKNVQTPPE